MSHRVIQFQTKVTSQSQADSLKTELNNKLDQKNYDLVERDVADGQDIDGYTTLTVTTEHNLTTEGKDFGIWLKNWSDTNKAQYNQNGSVSTDGICWMRYKSHDCWHNVQGQQEPCEVQDYKTFDIRPE